MTDVQLRVASRPSDMDRDAELVVMQEIDGDILVFVRDAIGHVDLEAQFCASGGKSPNTRRALISLMTAMRADLDGVIPEPAFSRAKYNEENET